MADNTNNDYFAEMREKEGVVSALDNPDDTVVVREKEYDSDNISGEVTYGRRRNAKRAKRVVLNIVDGKLDLSRTPEQHLTTLRTAIEETPDIAVQLGVAKVTTELPESLCNMAVDLLNTAERMIAVSALHVPLGVANRALIITKDQREALVPALKKVGEKYIPAGALEYSPEMELGFALLAIAQQHVLACRILMGQVQVQQEPNSDAAAA